ncbi:MAG: formylglycine-generating enzyme family protein [Planctomycetes bacterium]|nr:formylglycine-generating enzyme family protein [Planctomycetota bacterium]
MQTIRIRSIRQTVLSYFFSLTLIVMIAYGAGITNVFAQKNGPSPEVQVDIFIKAAKKDLDNERWEDAVERLDKAFELCVSLPGEFHFLYGKALFETGSYEFASSSLINYLTLVGENGRLYDEAISLLVDVENKQEKRMNQALELSHKQIEDVSEIEDNMVFINGGCFEMGDVFGTGADDEKPVHTVCISDFYLGRTEVTQKQWEDIVADNPSKYKGGDRPVERVSWDDVLDFIKKLNKKTGRHHRLPTEAEWEYAARSGGGNEEWAGTNSESEIGDYAWYVHNSSEAGTHVVAGKSPNGFGLYDMMGNVWEWCSDWYGRDYYEKSPKEEPEGPRKGSNRVIRGGGWSSKPYLLRSVNRNGFKPKSKKYSNIGFRLAWSP